MAERPRAGRDDGVTIAPGRSRGKSVALLAAAVALACVAVLVLFGRPSVGPRVAEAPRGAEAPAAAAAPPEAALAAPPAEPPAEAPAPVASPPPAPAAEPAPEPEAASEEMPSGIGLFPPPGTDPVKIGIVVPDDFELPEGFLRHYQATDDGQELEPILLFHPDYEVLGDDGRPLALPESRVVPPELAPPGLPIRMLELPPPRDPE